MPVDLYSKKIYNIAYQFAGSREEAEDLTQDTFVRAHGSGQLERVAHPRAYLLRIADNLVKDRFRRHSLGVIDATVEVTDADFPHPSASPEETTSARQEMEVLARAVGGLSEKVRQALILHKFHHLSYNEVAAVMGISPKTVEKHLAKGVEQCRAALGRERRKHLASVEPFPARIRGAGQGL